MSFFQKERFIALNYRISMEENSGSKPGLHQKDIWISKNGKISLVKAS